MRRLACAILIVLGCLMGMGAAPASASDSGPTLVSVSPPSAASVGPDGSVSWSVGVSSSSGSPLRSVSLVFLLDDAVRPGLATGEVEASVQGTTLADSPVVTGTVTVTGFTSYWQASGSFRLHEVDLIDAAGNQSSWLRDGDPGQGHTSATPPLSQADVEVVNSHPDTQPPRITSLALQTPTSITAGEPVVIQVDATDDLSGVNQMGMQLAGPDNLTIFLSSQHSSGDNQTFSAVIPPHVAGGTYTLGPVGVGDFAENSASVDPSQIPGGPIVIQVASPEPDTTPPSVLSVGDPLPTTAPGGAVGTHYVVSDNYPGDLTLGLDYRKPGETTNNPFADLMTTSVCDVWSGIASGETRSTDGQGSYQLIGFGVSDSAGNSVHVGRDGTETTYVSSTGLTTTVAPASGIDLSRSDMTTKSGAPVDTYGFALGSGCDDTNLSATATSGGVVGTVMRGTSPVVDPVLSVLTAASNGQATIVHGNKQGQFSARQVPVGSTVHFFGGLDSRGGVAQPASTAVAKVPSVAGVSFKTVRTGTRSRPRLRVNVTVKNGRRGDVVALEALHGHTWKTVTYLHANAKKQAGLTVTLPFRLPLRIDVPGTREHKQQIVALPPRLLR